MDHYSRSICLSLFALALLILALVVAASLIPFPVNFDGHITVLKGEVLVGLPQHTPAALEEGSRSIHVGERIQVGPGGEAIIQLFDGAIIVLEGPVDLSLRDAQRVGTLIEHVLPAHRPSAKYSVIIEQQLGRASYDFHAADPAFELIAIRVHLPSRRYIPGSPCWYVDVSASGQASSYSTDCPPSKPSP